MDSSECIDAHRVVSSDGDEPGTLRAGTAFQAAFPAIAALSDGSPVCLTCTGFMIMDHELDVKQTGGKPPYNLAVGPDDAIYAVQLPAGYKIATIELAAFERGGAQRWRQPLPGGTFAAPLAAVPGGVYVETRDAGLAFFAAETGERRELSSQALLAADRDGPFTMTPPTRTSPAREVTLRRLDANGTPRWERTWKAAIEGLIISAAVATRDGGLIVAGSAREDIDLGDRTLASPDGRFGSFLVALDASGTTLWAYRLLAVDDPHRALGAPGYLALTPSGEVLLAGNQFTDESHDAYLAIASATGLVRSHHIDGSGDQAITGLRSAGDGLAWLEIANNEEGDGGSTEMRISGHEFNEPAVYVFGIVP
jgi:outer membrane protein assembly factor BamB